MEQHEPMTPNRNSEQVSQLLDEWLSRPEWDLEEAHDWLLGYYLPPLGHDDYPGAWMYRALVIIEDRYEAETELARRMARVLRAQPDVSRPGKRPDELLCNLFMLCASLNYPQELGEPLFAVCERRALRGRWLGTDLRLSLAAALISNQIDQRLLPVWQAMIEGREDDFLIGNLKYGLDGITLMPASELAPDEPALDEIGKALKAIILHLHDEPERRLELEGYIRGIISTYPGRAGWNRELVHLADQNDWPDWAVVSLPSLCVPLKQFSSEKLQPLFLWETYLPIISEFGFEPRIHDRLCEDKILLLKLPGDAIYLLAPFVSVLEQRRLNIPLPTYSAVLGAVTDMMSVMEKFLSRGKNTNDADSIVGTGESVSPVLELMKQHGDLSKAARAVLTEARREILPKNRAGVAAATGK